MKNSLRTAIAARVANKPIEAAELVKTAPGIAAAMAKQWT